MRQKVVRFFKELFLGLVIAFCLLLFLEFLIWGGLRIALGVPRLEAFHTKMGRFDGPALNESVEDGKKRPKNNLGFLGPDFSIKKPRDTFRVLTIGGSAMSGELSKALRVELARNCPNKSCEVIDGGVPGSVSAHELNNLTRWLAFKPDLVIIYDGWNDVYFSHYAADAYVNESRSVNRRTRKWRAAPVHAKVLRVLLWSSPLGVIVLTAMNLPPMSWLSN